MAKYGFGDGGGSKVFEAKWRGLCATCNETIHPGDAVRYEDDELIHSDCQFQIRKASTTPDEVCPVCSLVHRGECF